MPEVQRSDSLRSAPEGEALLSAGKPSSPAEQTNSLPPVLSVTSASGGKPAERSVSFNRDVHVKRIGRGTPRVSAALTGDGEGRLIATPVRKERITSRSKEDLAQEAALVLQQAGSLRCVAHDNKSLPGKFSTLPARRSKKRPELPLNVRRKSEEIGATIPGDELLVAASKPTTTTTTTKKKALERSHSDASAKRVKGQLAKFFSPKLERRSKPVTRSVSDAGASAGNRKRSGSESEGSHLSAARAKKQLSPIIEASPRVDESQQPFNFGKKSKREPEVSPPRETSAPEVVGPAKPPRSPRRRKDRVDGEAARSGENGGAPPETVDEVDDTMIHSSRYDQQHGEESTIHKMIHRLSNDRSPPPQLTRTMVSPGPGFGHNNNRPFSYTRPNESSPPPPPNPAVIYAQVQMDKKKAAQRSHSDSDEGLGLDRKDSSRENSPADKDYLRRTDEYSSYSSDLRRKNELNSIDSHGDEDRKNVTHFGDFSASRSRHDELKRPHDIDDKFTSTVFVDASARGRADGMDARRRDSLEFSRVARNERATAISGKTSELSARRDLLESRIKSRLLADEMFFAAKKNGASVPRQVEHEIVEKPVVPPPVTPNRVASPKRYTDTYISETRTSSNGDKYIFEKEMHEDNGKVYGYEKKITNKIPSDGRIDAKPRDGYTVETRTDKYGDKYLVETRTHEGYADDFRPFLSDRSRTSPEERFRAARASGNNKSSGCLVDESARCSADRVDTSPIVPKKFSKSEDFLDRDFPRARSRDVYPPKAKRAFDTIRGMSKSTQRLDEVGENLRVRALRGEYTTRSHENLSTADYANATELRRRPPLASSPVKRGVVVGGGGGGGCSSSSSPFVKRHLPDLRERPNDDYDTDISQMTSSQLDSKYYRESTTRTTQRYKHHALRYDSDATARGDSSRYHSDEPARGKPPRDDAEPKKPARRSRDNRPDYFDDSDARDGSLRGKTPKGRLETFDESPPGSPPPRDFRRESESSSSRRNRHHETRHRETRLSDPDRKDRLADSGIENDYRRDSQEVDRREPLESEDEGFVTMQFIKRERRHTDRSMGLRPDEKRRFDKYVANGDKPLAALPPTGVDKKYEKKAAKKSGTMSRVKQLFSKREKKVKEEEEDEEEVEKNKKKKKKKKNPRGSSGALTDDEVTMRYREYKGDQLRSAKSARDLDSDVNREDYSRRRRLSTPSGSPSPPRPARLSRSTGTLTREEEPFCESSHTLTRENQGQEAERKGWFKSLSRKSKSNVKPIDKKQRIPESEILTTGTEDEEASSAPERVSVQKNLRFFGDTDQESISSNRECRNKRTDDHAGSRRCDVSNASRQTSSIVSPPRKPPRLAESALSSGESTTGDSSQQSQNSQRSQRSVVYLHAATVGEIPGPNERRRAASREELNRPLQSQTRTVSRSVSVLAPWKPRHYREPFEINYDQQQQQHHQHHQQKPTATIRRRHRSRETLSRREKEARRSKDNLSKTGTISRSTLKSKDKQKVDRTVSTESLANKSRNGSSRPELSRSTSVPRDPNKSAGWFKLKSKKSRA